MDFISEAKINQENSYSSIPTTYKNYSLKPSVNREYRTLNKIVNQSAASSLDLYKDEKKILEIKFTNKGQFYNSYGFYKNNIIVATESGFIYVYNFKGDLTNTLKGHNGPVNSLSLSEDSLVSGGKDKLIKVWNLKELTTEVNYNEQEIENYLLKIKNST